MSPFPKIPHAFFKWYCRPDRYEEMHGDLEEMFYEKQQTSGLWKAKLFYWLNVIRCCQPYAWRESSTSSSLVGVYANYYKMSFRILMKNPLSSFINIIGLSAAIAICVFVYGVAQWTASIDQFHEHKNEVYLVTFMADRDGSLKQNGNAPLPLGEMLANDFPEVEKVCRIEDVNVILKHDDDVYYEKVRVTDPTFLDMFTFPMKWGTKESLRDLNTIILTEDMSVKYFGDENPVGRDFQMIFQSGNSKQFKIGGVLEQFPRTAVIRFNFLLHFENLKTADPALNLSDWKRFIKGTLIQVSDPAKVQLMSPRMSKYKALQNEVEHDWAISSFVFEPLAGLYQKAGSITDDISSNAYESYERGITFIGIMGMFILGLACFNYINISIASAAKRLKEIGVRKAIGATRTTVTAQFLAENTLMTALALVLGLLFGAYVIIPWVEEMNGFNMDFRFTDGRLWVFIPSILLFTTIASGIYPALYISKFQAARIFNGTFSLGKENPLSKLFIGIQLVLSCILIVSGIMFSQNTTYISQRSWGYDPSAMVHAAVLNQSTYERLNAAVAENANVVSISGATHHLGRSHANIVITLPDRRYEVQQMAVDANYPATAGLRLVDGRFFRDSEGDREGAIVNQLFVRNLEMKDPIGRSFEIDGKKYEIVGVVEDFHSYNFYRKVAPMVITVADKSEYRFLAMKVDKGSELDVLQATQTQWAKLFPETPFYGGIQVDTWGDYFEDIKFHGRFWRIVAIMAVLLSSLGLYGLVSLNVSGRTREFSIRKVMGANLTNIASNIFREYWVLYTISMLVGGPVSYLLIGMLFDQVYLYHIPMNYWSVVGATVLLVLVLVTVVASQVRKVLVLSPLQGLKAD